MTPKEASRRLPNGAVELTGAKDADGIPVELTSRDVERMSSESVAEYKDRREKLIADRKVRRRRTTTTWSVGKAKAEGGTRHDAEAAYRAHRNEQAGAAVSLPPPACNVLDAPRTGDTAKQGEDARCRKVSVVRKKPKEHGWTANTPVAENTPR